MTGAIPITGEARATHDALVAARASYGRLLAWLAWQWRDIAAAEDALADAFAAALEHWPSRGVPDSPEGWLMTAAKRNLLDGARRRKLAEDPAFAALLDAGEAAPEPPAIPDDRLRLMLVCAHPAIEPNVRSALMLQTVLGIDAARIAGAFLVSPDAMARRLSRAKAKIKATGIRFESPDVDELEPRVAAALEAIYGAYVLDGGSWRDDATDASLATEALYLASLLAASLPAHGEALGLSALLRFCEARRPARLDRSDPHGARFVPLARQDVALWDRRLIAEAEALLSRAAVLDAPGPYQLEAAIQSAHCHRIHGEPTPWADIVVLYERLLATAPTTGARLGHAIAVAEATGDPSQGLRLIDGIEDRGRLATHQPWWAARAHLLAAAGQSVAAREAFTHAAALSTDDAVRRHLADRLREEQ